MAVKYQGGQAVPVPDPRQVAQARALDAALARLLLAKQDVYRKTQGLVGPEADKIRAKLNNVDADLQVAIYNARLLSGNLT